MSALQRGWQLGRSEADQDAGAALSPGGYSPSGYPPDESGSHQIPTESTTSTPGSAHGPYFAGTDTADPNPADSADQRDNE